MMTKKQENQYDVCIIGGSMAAINTAFISGLLGVKTALIQQDQINSPSFLFPALLRKTLTNYCHNNYKPDLNKAIEHCNNVLSDRLLFYKQSRIQAFGTNIIDDSASFSSKNTIHLQKSNTTIQAKYFMIATGVSTPIPAIPGITDIDILTEESVFDVQSLPKNILIYGGQEVAIEMAYIMKKFGCDITIVSPETLLKDYDPELTSQIRAHMEKDNISVYEHVDIASFVQLSSGLSVLKNKGFAARLKPKASKDKKDLEALPEVLKAQALFVALPKKANTQGLNLERAGIAESAQGIVADRRLRTANKAIYAAGRCVEGPDFSHNDMIHTKIFIKNALFKIPAKRKNGLKLRTLDSWIQMAQLGITEKQRREQYPLKPIHILRSPYDEVDGVVVTNHSKGLMKVITQPASLFKKEKILGVGIVGENAHDLIQLWLLGFEKKLPLKIIADMVTPYASLHEVSLKTASRPALKKMLNPSAKKIVQFLMRFS